MRIPKIVIPKVKKAPNQLYKLQQPVPKEQVGKDTVIFGLTRGDHFKPHNWSINSPKGNTSMKRVGHAHYAYIDRPETQLTLAGMYNTRGYNSPKFINGKPELELSTRAKTVVNTNTGIPEIKGNKTPYAFIRGKLLKVGELKELPKSNRKYSFSRTNLNNPDIDRTGFTTRKNLYKGGRLQRANSVEDLLQGQRDKFVSPPLKNKSNRELIGYKSFEEKMGEKVYGSDWANLSKADRKVIQGIRKNNRQVKAENKGKYATLSKVKLTPNGGFYYYSQGLNNLANF